MSKRRPKPKGQVKDKYYLRLAQYLRTERKAAERDEPRPQRLGK